MIKRIKNSLTIKICTLIAVLLAVSSGITYAVIVGFLPTYYSICVIILMEKVPEIWKERHAMNM